MSKSQKKPSGATHWVAVDMGVLVVEEVTVGVTEEIKTKGMALEDGAEENVEGEVGVRVVERLPVGERVKVSDTVPVGDKEEAKLVLEVVLKKERHVSLRTRLLA